MSSRVETSFIFITFSRLLSLVTSILALVILKRNTKTHKNRQCRSIENNKSKIDIIQFPHMFEAWMEIFCGVMPQSTAVLYLGVHTTLVLIVEWLLNDEHLKLIFCYVYLVKVSSLG